MSRSNKRIPRVGKSARLVPVGVAAGLCLAVLDGAVAQQATSLNGPPVQVIPYASEPGVPTIIINPGTPNPFPGGGPGTGGTGGGIVGDSSALATLMGTSWGLQAIQNAEALGLNPSALAATCVLESGCSQPQGGGGSQGAFQMFPAAYQEGLAAALAANPQLASPIVAGPGGVNDSTTAAIAASGYLMLANQSLQSAGISNPTVLDARGYYEFGPTYGVAVAQAPPGATMASLLPTRFLSNNGISPTETVSQWQASVSSKIGNASGQSVLG